MTKAVIKLAPGQTGFYDEISGIHLSMEKAELNIGNEVNATGLINAVKAGKIIVVSGSLESEAFIAKDAVKAIPTYYRLLDKKRKQELKKQRPVASEQVKKIVKEASKEAPKKIDVEITENKEVETVIADELIKNDEIQQVKEEKVDEVIKKEKTAHKKKKTKVEKTPDEVKED